MGSTRTTTKTIRIANEVAEYFEKKPLNRAVESLYGLLTSGKLKFDGENLSVECTHQNREKSSSGTPEIIEKVYTPDKNIPKSDYESLAEMANLMRVSTDKLLSDFKDMIENGDLYYSENRLVNPRYEDFEQLCRDRKQDPDKMMANVIRQMGG